ncbi:MAG: ribulose-phosphate 3-epimerase [Ruminococcaceae bacterium]|nr:ribulose-phosphate 3-epimerase [Oscillospiraceae bacterium]
MSVKISPSILSSDFLNLIPDIKRLEDAGIDMLHLDVMDGIFVPNISFGVPVIDSIKKHTSLPLDIHLMIDRPHRYIEAFAKYADYLGIHFEAGSDVAETLKKIRECGPKACLTIKPCTKPQEIFPLLPLCDMVLVMSVEPGFGGQSFMPSALDKLTALKNEIERQGLNILLEVDGGINKETAADAVNAGADVLVAGSFLFSDKMNENIAFLKSL